MYVTRYRNWMRVGRIHIDEGEIMDSIMDNVVKEITETREKMIWDAFYFCGFTKDRVIANAKSFLRICDSVSGSEFYYYKEKFLFLIEQSYDIDQNVATFKVTFEEPDSNFHPVIHEL